MSSEVGRECSQDEQQTGENEIPHHRANALVGDERPANTREQMRPDKSARGDWRLESERVAESIGCGRLLLREGSDQMTQATSKPMNSSTSMRNQPSNLPSLRYAPSTPNKDRTKMPATQTVEAQKETREHSHVSTTPQSVLLLFALHVAVNLTDVDGEAQGSRVTVCDVDACDDHDNKSGEPAGTTFGEPQAREK